MSSFKKLSKADITTFPYSANKQWTYYFESGSLLTSWVSSSYDGTVVDYGDITYYKGKKSDFNITGSLTTNFQYQSLIYDSINHLFYQKYNDVLDTGSLMLNMNTYESASEQRPTSSYFNYNSNPLFVNNFPTSSSSEIRILNVNRDVFGSKILPHSFILTSSLFTITDDGNGNLYDNIICNTYEMSDPSGDIFNYQTCSGEFISETITGSVQRCANILNYPVASGFGSDPVIDDLGLCSTSKNHIGNIFYAHGIIVITDSAYINIFPLSSPCSEYILYGSIIGSATFYYVTCSGNTYVTESADDTGIERCINNYYPIIISGSSGYGSYNTFGTCGGSPPVTNNTSSVTMSFKNEHIIQENEIHCIVRESEFNLSYNPSLVSGSYESGSLKDFATGSSFYPYATAIGLYNDDNELLMIAKLSKPTMISPNTDITFKIKYDT